MRWLQLRFDFDSTAIRPRYDHTTTYVTTVGLTLCGLVHRGIVLGRCASGYVVECRICNREVAGSNLGRVYFAPRSTQPFIPPGSANEYQLRLGRQREVWLIPTVDERVGVH